MSDHDKALEAAREIDALALGKGLADKGWKSAESHYADFLRDHGVIVARALLSAHAEIERLRAPATEEMVERAARAIVAARGAEIVASDDEWPRAIAHYRRMVGEYGARYTGGRSLIHDAMRDARAALSALHPAPDGTETKP